MKTGRLVGVLVLTGVGIGALLSYVLPDFGFNLGPGSFSLTGNPAAKSEKNDAAKSVEGETTGPISANSVADDTEGTGSEQAPPPVIVYVLIDGRDYLVRLGPEGKAAFKPASLSEVIAAAQSATGDENGLRVRIEERSSARETAEQDLRKGLRDAGIPGDAIRWRDDPVEG